MRLRLQFSLSFLLLCSQLDSPMYVGIYTRSKAHIIPTAALGAPTPFVFYPLFVSPITVSVEC